MIARRAWLLALLALAASPAAAQSGVQRIRGTVRSWDGTVLTVKNGDSAVSVTLSGRIVVNQLMPGTLADIKPGDFVGMVAYGPPDKMRAATISIFPEALRGAGEGHRPWDTGADSSMTNATIDANVAGTDGHVLTLKAKDQSYTATVTPQTVIITRAPGSPALLVPGAWVMMQATPNSAGELSATSVNVGKDGFAPPM